MSRPDASSIHWAVLAHPGLSAPLQQEGGLVTDLAGIAGDPSGNELPGSVVVIDDRLPGAHALLEAYALRRPDVGMLLIGDDLPAQAVRALFRFAASDVLACSATAEMVQTACQTLAAKARKETAPASGATCWALRGAVGGAGVTTLAIETAFAMKQRQPTWQVCLIDLNLTDGMSAAFLDGQKKLDVAGLCAAPERIDSTLLRAYAWEHEKGIFLLAGPRAPLAEEVATRDGILQLLDVACGMFDHVVVDLPRHRTPWTDPILSVVDEVLVVSELTVPSLHAAGDLCREVDALRTGVAPAKLVLNRMFAKRSHRHSFPVDKAERAIHRKIDFTIRSDWDSARMAANLGMPIAQVKARSPLVKDIASLVETLVEGTSDTQERGAA
ncbi:MAG: hypothetical protein MRY64_02955 [Hyphomonadaceae bacterium]|nr:hypothetical protein [Hyphomonadaceae bacterium]